MNTENRKLNIAFIGTKGIPAKWGGIEKYVQEIGRRLADRGHAVSVFGSRWYCKEYVKKSYLFLAAFFFFFLFYF